MLFSQGRVLLCLTPVFSSQCHSLFIHPYEYNQQCPLVSVFTRDIWCCRELQGRHCEEEEQDNVIKKGTNQANTIIMEILKHIITTSLFISLNCSYDLYHIFFTTVKHKYIFLSRLSPAQKKHKSLHRNEALFSEAVLREETEGR